MLHERALQLLASWEDVGGPRECASAARQKFQYVISAQAYGNHKKSRDLKAADTEFLLQRYPSLRVAYVDKASSLTKVQEADGRPALKEAIRFYSVLIKGARFEDEAAVQEVCRMASNSARTPHCGCATRAHTHSARTPTAFRALFSPRRVHCVSHRSSECSCRVTSC